MMNIMFYISGQDRNYRSLGIPELGRLLAISEILYKNHMSTAHSYPARVVNKRQLKH